MTNYERYKNEIDKIVRMGRMVAVEEKTGRVTSCSQITCFECKFDSCSSVDCDTAALAWADAEYIESKDLMQIEVSENGYYHQTNDSFRNRKNS